MGDMFVTLWESIGAAFLFPHGFSPFREDRKAFVHRVDRRMYRAKADGKNRVCYLSVHPGKQDYSLSEQPVIEN